MLFISEPNKLSMFPSISLKMNHSNYLKNLQAFKMKNKSYFSINSMYEKFNFDSEIATPRAEKKTEKISEKSTVVNDVAVQTSIFSEGEIFYFNSI